MAQAKMNVKLIAHTQLSREFLESLSDDGPGYMFREGYYEATDGQVVALTAIRTCYSPLKPSDIVDEEGDKYFGKQASDGQGGTDAERLFRHIVKSGHTSTLEHLTYTFAIEGVSRSLLAQLTRHRHMSFSVQSQRYVKMGSGDKSGGFDYVVPPSVEKQIEQVYKLEDDGQPMSMSDGYTYFMNVMQKWYDFMRENGIPPEDARFVLPNAAATNMVMTANLRTLLDFYGKRRKGKGAQWEITDLAERIRECVVEVEPWLDQFFDQS